MMKVKSKVLITCPPMLLKIEDYRNYFDQNNFEVTTPKIIQTLSEKKLLDLVPKHDGWIIGDDVVNSKIVKAGKEGSLKAAVKWGVGLDNIDINALNDFGIKFTHTPNAFGDEVSDLAMAYILALARNIHLIDKEVRTGNWYKPQGISLKGKTMGILGLGDIGKNIAHRAKSFGLDCVGWDPFLKEVPQDLELAAWPKKIEKCDFIVLSCPLNSKTEYILNEKVFKKMKEGVMLVNVSRGKLINEKDLIKFLENQKIKSAALDVFEDEPLRLDNPLIKFKNCLFGSHNASNTLEAVDKTSVKSIMFLKKLLK